MITKDAVWLITGCSKGLGRAMAERVLAHGHRLVATARNADAVADIVAAHPDRAIALPLDVTDKDQIATAVAQAEARFGRIDVLVNNAGYAYLGALEEGEDAAFRESLETNLFGPLNMIKAVLPGMRQRGHGHIVNMSSIGGIVTFPAVGHYHIAKFGVEALSETLAQEVAPFGIGVTVVEPGAFRTDFRSSDSARQSSIRLPAYANTPGGKGRDAVLAGHGKQQGDPHKGADAIIGAVEAEQPPLHLVIGGDALDQFRGKMAGLQQELDAWEAVSRGTDLDA